MGQSFKAAATRRPDRQTVSPRGEAIKLNILNAAIRLFARQGVAATSIDDIVEEAKVARMTLYHHFPSKEQLVIAALVNEGARWRRYFFAELAKVPGTPRDRLLGVFDVFERWFKSEDYAGCAFMNTILANYMPNEEVLRATMEHKRPVLDQLEALAGAAGADNPESLAYQIDLLMNGAIVNAVIQRNPRSACEARTIAGHLLAAALQ
jgi:AcrR family transcriptional regulator